LVNTSDSARLLAGTVFVNVTEISNGFLLETPEAQIIDEGTQYAVAQDSLATEVHVFDGSVIFAPTDTDSDFEDRISAGEARRYLRSEPGRANHIPFGQRQFVRRIEDRVREAGDGELLAYDGFENLAGQIRRDRSGFGWSGGWESAGPGRGPLAEVINAPNEVVFGIDRSGRRQLSLRGGESLRRQFEKPIELVPGKTIFVSMLISRQSDVDDEEDAAIQIVLEPDSVSPRFTRRHSVSIGVRSDRRLFLNNSGTIDETATSLAVGEPHLIVLMYTADSDTTTANLRVYRPNELVDKTQPSVWTVSGTASTGPTKFDSIRLSLGNQAAAQIDELRVSDSWNAAVNFAN
jgi:FecR protein